MPIVRNSKSPARPWKQHRHAAPLSVEEERRGDPGYHLLAGGRRAFEAAIGFRSPPSAWPGRLSRKLGIGGYVGAGLTVAAVLLAIPLVTLLHTQGLSPVWLSLLGIMGMVPAIDAAVALVNRCMTRGFGATLLPALELRGGVPAHLRTIVAVPTMLTTTEAIAEQIERLEVHHLASPEGELHFALLSDWLDAATPCADGDEAAAASGDGRYCTAQSTLWPGTRWRPLPAASSQARLERQRSAVDRLGAQARQVARTESAAARRERHHFPAHRRRNRQRFPPTSATSSHSTPTPGCRATRSAG